MKRVIIFLITLLVFVGCDKSGDDKTITNSKLVTFDSKDGVSMVEDVVIVSSIDGTINLVFEKGGSSIISTTLKIKNNVIYIFKGKELIEANVTLTEEIDGLLSYGISDNDKLAIINMMKSTSIVRVAFQNEEHGWGSPGFFARILDCRGFTAAIR